MRSDKDSGEIQEQRAKINLALVFLFGVMLRRSGLWVWEHGWIHTEAWNKPLFLLFVLCANLSWVKYAATHGCFSFHTLKGFSFLVIIKNLMLQWMGLLSPFFCWFAQRSSRETLLHHCCSECEQRGAVLGSATRWRCVLEFHAACLFHISACSFIVSTIFTVFFFNVSLI